MDLTAPTAPTYTAPGTLKVGEAIAVMNPSGGIGIDEYSATGLPSGLNLDTGTGAIGGTPDAADANTADVTVTVSDAVGNTAEVPITFPAVAKGDQTLTGFQYSASSVAFGSAAPTVTAPGGVETTVSYLATPLTVCTVESTSGALTLEGVGSCVITATAAGTDHYNEATATFTVAVQAAGALVLNLDAIAGDDTVNIAEKVAGFTITGDTGTESGVSVTVEIGTATLPATSADDSGTATWSVSVAADATYISGTSLDVEVNATKTGFTAPATITRTLTVDLTAPTAPTYTAPASLKVGVPITEMSPSGGVGIDEYAVTGLPSGLSLDTGTGAIGGTPDTADANTADVTVTVSDAAGNTAEVPITFPAVAKGDQTLTGFQYSASSVAFGSAAPTVTAPGGVGDDRVVLGDSVDGVYRRTDQRYAHPGGCWQLRHHGHGGRHRRLQRGHCDVHRHGAGRRHAVAEPRRDRHRRQGEHRREGRRVHDHRRHRIGGRGQCHGDGGHHRADDDLSRHGSGNLVGKRGSGRDLHHGHKPGCGGQRLERPASPRPPRSRAR